MRIDIMTLFPETVHAVLHESVIGRAANNGTVEINCVQIRDFTENSLQPFLELSPELGSGNKGTHIHYYDC